MSIQTRSSVTRSVTSHNIIQSISTTAFVMSLGLVSGIVAARALGVAGRGELAAVILWPAVLTSLAELGLPTAFVYLAASREHARSDLARSVLPLVAVQVVGVYLVGVPVVLTALAAYSGYVRATAVGFLVVYAPVFLCTRYLSTLNQGAGRLGVMNLARLPMPTAYSAALLAMVVAGVVGVRPFAAAFVGSCALVLVVLFVVSTPETRSALVRPRVDWVTARESWSIGRNTYFGSLAPVDSLQLDVLLTTAILGAREAGLYYVAASAGYLVRVWGPTLGFVALPRTAAARSREEALELLASLVRITTIVSGLMAAVIFVFAEPLLRLVYGGAYASAEVLVRILAVGMVAASLRCVIGDGMRGLGEHSKATHAEVAGWIGGGLAVAVLLPILGVTGVALAVCLSYTTTLVVMLGFANRLGIHPARLIVPKAGDFSRGWAAVRSATGGKS